MADKSVGGQPTTSVTAFERLVFTGEYAPAMEILVRILDAIERGADLPRDATDDEGARRYCTRLAAAIVTLFAMDRDRLSPRTVDLLAFHNRHLTAIFRLSGYADPGSLYALVKGAREGQNDEATAARLLATVSIASPADINWRGMLPKHGAVASSAFLAQFSHRAPLSAEADRRREAMLALAPLLEGYALRESQFPLLGQAWMFSSYLTAPDRHDLKQTLNMLVAGWLERAGIFSLALPDDRSIADKPVLVVIADVLISWHAMFKTYANFLRQLSKRFHLVLVTLADRTDDSARALFDEVFEIADTPLALREVVARVESIGPAMLYYPSVGMSVLTVQLCNLRLAPIQAASVGHPATTHSPMIDYMVMGHTYYSDAARFSERVLLLQSTGALFEPTLGAKPAAPRLREAPDTLRIAVSSSTLKLNADFLSLCRAVESEAGRNVEFHFFPNEQGIRHHDCAHQVRQFLPSAIVHPRVGYDDYLALLNECDIRFGTFPFGGANTTMDACLLGIPTVTLAGVEPHSRTDSRFVTLFELPEWLVAKDMEAYLAAALRLIRNDAERIALSRRILDADPGSVLFSKEQDAYPTDFADTLWWAYEHHETILATERRVWGWEDRIALAENSV